MSDFKGFWQVKIYSSSGSLVDLPQSDVESVDLEDVMNGGSGNATVTFRRNFNQIGAVAFGNQVQVWIWGAQESRPNDPYYSGHIVDIDQVQLSASGQVVAKIEGDAKLLDNAIVTEQTNPGIQGNGNLDAGAYVKHLLSTYQPTSFSAPTIPATTFNMFPTNFDGTKLGAAVDTVLKQGQDLTGLIFTWYVRTKADLTKSVLVQVDQNPNSVSGVKFKHLFLQSMLDKYTISTKYRDIINVVAVYGAKDPQTGQQVFGVYKDATSVTNYGPIQDKISVPALTTQAGCQSYATTWLTLHAYPQAQGSARLLQPDSTVKAGVWVQIWETPATASASAVIKQVRCAQVKVSIRGERIEQSILTQSPIPYLDEAVYRMGMNVAVTQQIINTPLSVNKQTLFVRTGGTITSTANSPARVAIDATEAVFPNGTVFAAALALTALTDNSGGPNNGQSGDGNFTVSLNSSGNYIITKGPRPQNTSTQQNLCALVVDQGAILAGGTTDLRTLNGQPAFSPSIGTPALKASTTVSLGLPSNSGSGAYDQPFDFWLDPATWTKANPAFAYLEIGAVPHGSNQQIATYTKVLPTSDGHYIGAVPGLGGGTSYDLYVRAHDNIDRPTQWLSIGTTNANPISPSFGTRVPTTGPTFSVTPANVVYTATSPNSYSVTVPFTATNQASITNATGVSVWYTAHGQTTPITSLALALNSSGAYSFTIPNLPDGTQTYDVWAAFTDVSGNPGTSANFFTTSSFTAPPAGAGGTMPSGTVASATYVSNPLLNAWSNPYLVGVNFTIPTAQTTALWLHDVKLVYQPLNYTFLTAAAAAGATTITVNWPMPGGVAAGDTLTFTQGSLTETKTVSSVGTPTTVVAGTQTNTITLTAGLTNSYSAYACQITGKLGTNWTDAGKLPANSGGSYYGVWACPPYSVLAVQLIDYAGNASGSSPVLFQVGSYRYTQGGTPQSGAIGYTPNVVSTGSLAYNNVGNGAYDALETVTFDGQGTNRNPWLQLVEYLISTNNSTTTLNGAVAKGATSIVLTSASGVNANDQITLDTGSNIEHVNVQSVSGTTVTLQTPLQLAHATGVAVTTNTWKHYGYEAVNASGAYNLDWVSMGAGNVYQLGVRYVDTVGGVSFVVNVGQTAANPILVTNTNLQAMPSAIKTNGPTLSASAMNARTNRQGLIQSASVTFTETDFTAKPTWIDKIILSVRVNGDTTVSRQIQIDPASSSNGSYSTSFLVTRGDEVDVGLSYSDVQGQFSNIVWPAGWSAQADPDGDFMDPSDRTKVAYGRHHVSLQKGVFQKNLVVNGNNTSGSGAIPPTQYAWTTAFGGGSSLDSLGSFGPSNSYTAMRLVSSPYNGGFYQDIPCIAGQTYTFCCLVESTIANLNPGLWIGSADGAYTQYNASPGTPIGSLGQFYTSASSVSSVGWYLNNPLNQLVAVYGTFTVPTNAAINKMRVILYNSNGSVGGTSYFAGVMVIPGTRLQDYIDHELNAGGVHMDRHVIDGATYGRVKNSELATGTVKQLNDGTNIRTAANLAAVVDGSGNTPSSSSLNLKLPNNTAWRTNAKLWLRWGTGNTSATYWIDDGSGNGVASSIWKPDGSATINSGTLGGVGYNANTNGILVSSLDGTSGLYFCIYYVNGSTGGTGGTGWFVSTQQTPFSINALPIAQAYADGGYTAFLATINASSSGYSAGSGGPHSTGGGRGYL